MGAPPPHPASELVELAKAEPVRVLHNHQAGVGHVHPHLNDRGGYQDIHFPRGKGRHDPLLVPCLLLSVDNSHPQIGKDLFLKLAAILLRRLQALRVLLSTAGQTIYTWWPWATCFRTKAYSRARLSSRIR